MSEVHGKSELSFPFSNATQDLGHCAKVTKVTTSNGRNSTPLSLGKEDPGGRMGAGEKSTESKADSRVNNQSRLERHSPQVTLTASAIFL